MKRVEIIIMATALAVSAQAQDGNKESMRKFVVADMETRIPIRDVRVITNNGYRDTTNYRGICYIPAQFDTIVVYKPNYLPEKLAFKEVKDSTFLLSNSHRIGEVTVWGEDRFKAMQNQIDRWSKEAAREGKPQSAGFSLSFDFGKMLDKRYRHDQKQLKRTREAFKQMDEAGKNDPIERAYKNVLEQKQLESERKKAAAALAEQHAQKQKEELEQTIANYENRGDTADINRQRMIMHGNICEEIEPGRLDGWERHTYYYTAAANALRQAIGEKRLTVLQDEAAYSYVTVQLAERWNRRITDIVDSVLTDSEKNKLRETERALIVQMQVGAGGKTIEARLRFLDPYQAVPSMAQMDEMLQRMQQLQLEGLQDIPADKFLTLSFIYPLQAGNSADKTQ